MFTKNSAVVQIWSNLIKQGTYTEEQVPNLFNLQAAVAEALAEPEETITAEEILEV